MDVQLVSYTPDAKELLIFTKNTRLEMSPSLLKEIHAWTDDQKNKEIAYIARTIPSSHEFVDYVFCITGVSRAFTHQFVRTRQGSYAQQTMRVLKMSNNGGCFDYVTGPTIAKSSKRKARYDFAMATIRAEYDWLIDDDAAIEDARGILPTNICTNIVAKFNLRTLSEMKIKRSGVRSQEEYRDVLALMAQRVYEVHPWAELFIAPKQTDVVQKLEALAVEVRPTSVAWSNEIQKSADLLKTRTLA